MVEHVLIDLTGLRIMDFDELILLFQPKGFFLIKLLDFVLNSVLVAILLLRKGKQMVFLCSVSHCDKSQWYRFKCCLSVYMLHIQ